MKLSHSPPSPLLAGSEYIPNLIFTQANHPLDYTPDRLIKHIQCGWLNSMSCVVENINFGQWTYIQQTEGNHITWTPYNAVWLLFILQYGCAIQFTNVIQRLLNNKQSFCAEVGRTLQKGTFYAPKFCQSLPFAIFLYLRRSELRRALGIFQ